MWSDAKKEKVNAQLTVDVSTLCGGLFKKDCVKKFIQKRSLNAPSLPTIVPLYDSLPVS